MGYNFNTKRLSKAKNIIRIFPSQGHVSSLWKNQRKEKIIVPFLQMSALTKESLLTSCPTIFLYSAFTLRERDNPYWPKSPFRPIFYYASIFQTRDWKFAHKAPPAAHVIWRWSWATGPRDNIKRLSPTKLIKWPILSTQRPTKSKVRSPLKKVYFFIVLGGARKKVCVRARLSL